MFTILIALLSAVGFILAYRLYGRWLGSHVFRLTAKAVCPSEALNDNRDYVPTRTSVVFGHHFTSIAGTGPIVGPAIAVMWGWLPALLWVLFGSIFIGAVHDFASLVISMRNRGQTVGIIAGRLLNPRFRLLFLLVLFLALTIVLAIFGLVIASVFRLFPSAIFPCVVQIPLAIVIGLALHRRGIGLFWPSLVGLVLMLVSVAYGDVGWLHTFNQTLAAWPIWSWVVVLLVYSYIASILPVWLLLQPRDYINSLQLVLSLALLLVGLLVAGAVGITLADGEKLALEMPAPLVVWNPAGAPPIFPFLFITIACGAISGFHCLVSSGTSSKQLRKENDATVVGYGGMLQEGFLAVLVILACTAGLGLGMRTADGGWLTGFEAWHHQYASWGAAQGLAAKLGAFVNGSANFLLALGLPNAFAVALMGVLVASFAGTTLDSACRLQRYVIQELAESLRDALAHRLLGRPLLQPLRWLENPYVATFVAVALAMWMAAMPLPGSAWSLDNAGKGGMILWPLFAATNQLLGGLAFVVIFFYLWRRKMPFWFMVVPAIFMLIIPFCGMFHQAFIGSADSASWLASGNWLLLSFAVASLGLEIWLLVEAWLLLPKSRAVREPGAVPHLLDSA